MSESGVYRDEMLKRFSDQDVERLLSGKTPENGELAELAPILRALHTQREVPSEERVVSFAAEAAELARSTERPGPGAQERTLPRARSFVFGLRKSLATGLAAVLLLSGLTGVAVAANGAAPGDILFGVDQLLEEIGLGDGGAAERIAEAQSLFNDGQVAAAIAHAAQAVKVSNGDGNENIEVLTSGEATEALTDVLEKLTNDETDANDHVAALFEYMVNTDDTGSAFGQGVAARAREIAGDNSDPADNGADNAADNATEGANHADEGLDTAEEATDNSGTDTADEATDNPGTDTADEATENSGTDTADEVTESNPPGRP